MSVVTPVTGSQSRAWQTRLRQALDGLVPADGILALFFASVLWLPPVFEDKAYLPTLALLVLFAGYRTIRERRLPPLPIFLVAYVGVYVLATVHGGSVGLTSLKHGYFVRPVTAVAIATIVTTSRQRLRVLMLVVLFATSQVPITAVQVSKNLVRYGRHATHTGSVDTVTGSLAYPLEPYQGSVVTLIALIAAAIVISSWLWGTLKTKIAVPICAGLLAVGAFASTRAAPLFVLVVGAALVAAALTLRAWRPSTRRILAVGFASIAAAAAVSGLNVALYADLYSGISKEWLGTIGGGAAYQKGEPSPAKESPAKVERSLANVRLSPKVKVPTTALLPGRIAQLKLAVQLSVRDGAVVALLGRGPASSEPDKPSYPNAQSIPPPKRTGSTWLGKVLTETGWLGLTAFLALLIWLILLGRRLCRPDAATGDRVLGVALAGVAALTGAAAAYGTFPTLSGYAVVFWALVGLAISAARDAHRRPSLP